MSAVISLTPPTSVAAHSPTSSVVASAHPAPYGWQTHVVRPGDTLSDLAIAHRTTVGALVAHNGLTGGGTYLRLGQRLSVPRTTSPAQDAARAEGLRWTGYTVHPGDTIGAIALRLGTSESGILAANGLQRTSVIRPGQRLRVSAKAVRAARAAAAPAMSTQRVRVRPGDTVDAIALRHGVTQASILKANALAPGSVIYAGTVLRIPVGSSPTAGQTTFAGRRYSSAVVGAAGVNRGYLAGAPVPGRSDTRAMIVDTARRHGLDPRLALAVAWQESGWSQRQVSVANAIGRDAGDPRARAAWASALAGRRLDLLNTQDNVTAGVVILRSLTRAAASRGAGRRRLLPGAALGAGARDVRRHAGLRAPTCWRSRPGCSSTSGGSCPGRASRAGRTGPTRRLCPVATSRQRPPSSGRCSTGATACCRTSRTAAWPRSTSALDDRLDREVALKVMRPSLADDEDVRQPVQPRGPVGRPALSHPNVVAVYDQGEDDGHDVPGDGATSPGTPCAR